MAKRPTLKVIAHYIIIDGQKTEVDPKETNLPDLCKLAMAEIATGKQYELREVSS